MNHNFPSHLGEKDRAWRIKFCRAAWSTYNRLGTGGFYNSRDEYRVYRDYAMSQQSIGKYKRILNVHESGDQSLLSIDFTPLAIPTKFRNLALSISKKIDYDIGAIPIDTLAQEQVEAYFRKQETRIKLRQELSKINPELIESSPLALKEGEPRDMDELAIQKQYTYKHQLSIEIEQWISAVFEHNDITEVRSTVKHDIFDCGCGGIKESIDSDGSIKIRAVRPEGFICGPATKRDLSDAGWMGEVYSVTIAELRELAGDSFSEEEYSKIASMYRRRSGRGPYEIWRGIGVCDYDDQKVLMLDIEIKTTSEQLFEMSTDKRGNSHVTRISRKRAAKNGFEGVKAIYPEVLQVAKWIVDTEYMFDDGLGTDMKRKKGNLSETSFSYSMFAPNWDVAKQKSTGYMEQCIPIIDQLNLAWFRLQHVVATARPRGVSIELSAIEDVSLGKGGKALTKKEIIELFNHTGNLVWRRIGIDGEQSHYAPIQELENGLGRQAEEYFNLIQKNIQLLRDTLGLNEATDSFTGSRTYGAAVSAALESTNNSLYGLIESDFHIIKSTANSTLVRIQQAVRTGRIHKSYAVALGENSIRFLREGVDLSMHELGIKLYRKATDEERARFMASLDEYAKAGLIDMEDKLIMENMENLKQAGQVLAYRLKKKKEEAIKEKRADMEANARYQAQAAQLAEEEKRKTLDAEARLKAQLIQLEKQWDLKIAQVTSQGTVTGKHIDAAARVESSLLAAESKEHVAETTTKARKEEKDGRVMSDLLK